jgi:hypothetical protein
VWTQVCRWPLILCLYIFANSAVAAFAEHEKLGRKENLQVAARVYIVTRAVIAARQFGIKVPDGASLAQKNVRLRL